MKLFLFVIGGFILMEFVAWISHKYIMHGILWKWHKDHHINDHTNQQNQVAKKFEKNDLFFLVFASPAIVLMLLGFWFNHLPSIALSIGITLYGVTYFTIHDIVIHNRIPFGIKFSGKYISSLIKAHQGHHKPKTKADFDSYGLLVFPKRYLKQNR